METNSQESLFGERPSNFDSLLESLLIVSQSYGHKSTGETILAGLPLERQKLTPNLFVEAAERCGLTAKITKQSLKKIHTDLLPAIILLKDDHTCIITEVNGSEFTVIEPQNKDTTTKVTKEELKKIYSGYTIYTQETFEFDERTAELAADEPKHWFWGVVQKAWATYSEVLIASLLINVFAIAVPLFVMNVYDRVVPNNAVETLWVLSIGMLIVIVFEFIMRTLRGYYIDSAGRKIDLQLSSKTFAHVVGLRMADRPNSVGSLSNTMQSFEAFREFITSASISLLVDLPFSLLFVAVIWLISPNIVIVPVIAIPLILLVSLAIQKPIEYYVDKSYRHSAEKQAILVESLSSSETIKSLNAEGSRQKQWEQVTNESTKLGLKVRSLVNFGMNFAIGVQYLSLIFVVITGVYAIAAGELTIGGLIACSILNGRALAPIVQAANLLVRYKQSTAALNALDSIMEKETDRPKRSNYIELKELKGSVEFKDVDFAYPNQPVPALHNISLKINPGDKVGIVGPAGSGKSTLSKIILKFYQPNTGHILIDDIDGVQIDPAFLRRHIGYIPQNVTLFHGSIRDNIVMAAPYIDDEALLRAAKISGVHQFVNEHPEGYDRQVGEGGNLLSGGQKQAIAIARAILLDPQVYLFDEPTNSLDNARIKEFITQMEQHIQGKTFIVVSHKASILSLVDQLVVMQSGKIVARGPKEKILNKIKGATP